MLKTAFYPLNTKVICNNKTPIKQLKFKCQCSTSSIEAPLSQANRKREYAKIGVLGASGYTGSECVRLLSNHPSFQISTLTAERQAGKELSEVFPQLNALNNIPKLEKIEDVNFDSIDGLFCCLPHATTQDIVLKLPKHLSIVDLSADFRLRDPDEYEEWYGHKHMAISLQEEAVYGLTEVSRPEISVSRLIANPGCYPTTVLLPLIPLIKSGLIETNDIIIDAKSGVSGAGRSPAELKLYCEVTEGVHAYGIASHRHLPEIEQELSRAAGSFVNVSFTPHVMPMSRGMLSSIYVKMASGITKEILKSTIEDFYADDKFVKILPGDVAPQTRHVKGSNYNFINVFEDRLSGRAIIMSCIDNLVKGASGQAIQNMNLMMGLDDSVGLMQQPLFP